MIRERLRRAALVVLDVEDEHAERDWEDMEGQLQDARSQAAQARDEADEWKKKADGREEMVARMKGRAERAEHVVGELTSALRKETDYRVAAEKKLRDVAVTEHESAVGALHAILAEIDKRLPPPGTLLEDDRDPHRLVLRTLRNLVTRGMQNDQLLRRDYLNHVDALQQRMTVAFRAAAHFRAALDAQRKAMSSSHAKLVSMAEDSFFAIDRIKRLEGPALVEAAGKFGLMPIPGEEHEAFRRRVLALFPHDLGGTAP